MKVLSQMQQALFLQKKIKNVLGDCHTNNVFAAWRRRKWKISYTVFDATTHRT